MTAGTTTGTITETTTGMIAEANTGMIAGMSEGAGTDGMGTGLL
eukprot:CAMPEP_0181271612 /NCGR_PEP_ID=MMETSP1097-20121128/7500_1 /TAXON_ID=35684 /ORGANISM="Pseudopedinella elastica, Strain CCMP716" /LENGTH=43 /DNA_ID= /DNA_START= /DNA_END= /DNA_ORIENTATION=